MLKKAIIVGAVWVVASAGAAAALSYEFETSWYYGSMETWYFSWSGAKLSGNGELVEVVPYLHWEPPGRINELYVKHLDAGGNDLGQDLLGQGNLDSIFTKLWGFRPFGDGFLVSYGQYWDSGTMEWDQHVLKRTGSQSWSLSEITEHWPYVEPRFKVIATRPDGTFYYCYRYYEGAYRVCKSPGTSSVDSYFTPASDVGDMVADNSGVLFISAGATVYKYQDTGSLITDWAVPGQIVDLSLDGASQLLVLTENKTVYIYDDAGSYVSSFTGPIADHVDSADAGPDGKYYVLTRTDTGSGYGIRVYRFAPDMTNIQPASLGRIKAMFQ